MRTSGKQFIEQRFRVLFGPFLLTFLIFGFSFTIIGALLPRILSQFHWSYTAAGLVLAGGSCGYIASTLVFGILLGRIGPKAVIAGGLFLLSASLFFFGRLPSVPYNLALNFLIGVGQGAIELVVNYSVVRMERRGESHLMSFMHASFSVGAIVGPALIAVILSRGLPWLSVYRLIAGVAFLTSAGVSLLPFSRLRVAAGAGSPGDAGQPDSLSAPSQTGTRATASQIGVAALLRYPMLILSVSAVFLYVGLELGISSWVSEYYVTIFGAPAAAAAFMVSLFWFGVFTGRTLIPVLYRGPRQAETLLVLALLYTVSLFFALLMRGPLSAGVFFYFTSLGCSAFYPLVMTLVGRYFVSAQSEAVGFTASAGGIGSLVFPLFMSAVAQRAGIQVGFLVYLFMGIVLAGAAYLIVLQLHRKGAMS